MPNLNPLVTGDVPFPQYSVTTTQQIKAGVTITKGVIYTKDAFGELVVSTGNLTKGIFQARETPTVNVPALQGDEVQVLGPRSRMLLLDTVGNLVEGDNVDNPTNTDRANVALVTTGTNYIGRVFEIYTKDANGTKKILSEIGDLVVVETVGP